MICVRAWDGRGFNKVGPEVNVDYQKLLYLLENHSSYILSWGMKRKVLQTSLRIELQISVCDLTSKRTIDRSFVF